MNDIDFDAPPSPDDLHGSLRSAVDAILAAPGADFEAWQQRCLATVATFAAPAVARPRKRKMFWRFARLAAGAAAVVAVCFGTWSFTSRRPAWNAFAESLEQIQKAKTISWKSITYMYVPTGKDNKGQWIRTDEERSYKAPDIYREVRRDAKNQIEYIRITDTGHDLFIYPRQKTAHLEETDVHHRSYGPRGPFSYGSQEINQWQWVGTRVTPTGKANIFRWPGGPRWSVDIWVDQRTKRVVRHQVPGADIYDPENDREHNNPIGKPENWPNGAPISSIDYDIVYDAKLADSLFSFESPKGYKLTVQHRNYVTEAEMIQYLGIMAEVSGRAFPARTPNRSDQLVEPDVGKLEKKPAKDHTPAERRFLESVRHSMETRLDCGPLFHFIRDSVVPGSFMYVGTGVKLGDRQAIVCWYRLKDAKTPHTYRVVYGDLSVKNVAAKDLPLPIDP